MPPTSCSPRSTPRRAQLWLRRAPALGVAVRHGRLHPRPAAQAGRGLPGHAAGGGRCRPAAARGRCREPAVARADAPRSSACSTRSAPREVPQILVFNKLDLLEARAARAQLRDWVERADGRARAARLRQRARRRGLDALRELLADGRRAQRLERRRCAPSAERATRVARRERGPFDHSVTASHHV